ncbi:MAG: hypothetical protein RLZZ316_1475 [Bacteroidota bacterium]
MKKFYTTLVMLMLLASPFISFSQGSFTSNATGNWSVVGTWTLSSGADADGIPDADDDVTIAAGQTVTLTANAAVNSLTLNSNSGTRLAIASFVLDVNGTVNGPSTNFSNNIITTTTGRLKFVGGNRALFGTNWAASHANWRAEVALTGGATGTASTNVKVGDLIISSGTFDCGGELRIDNTGNGTGSITIASLGTLIAADRLGQRTNATNTYCNTIDVFGLLEYKNGTHFNGESITIRNGGKLRINRSSNIAITSVNSGASAFNFNYEPGSTLEYINAFGTPATTNFILTGAELSQGKITSNPTLEAGLSNIVFDAVADNEVRVAASPKVYASATMKRGFAVTTTAQNLLYQTNATLVFNGSVAQRTHENSPAGNATIIWPTTNGPANVTINNAAGVTLGNNAGSRTVSGVFTFNNGKLITDATHLLTIAAGGSISGASSTNFIDGPLLYETNATTAVTLPTGKGSAYKPCIITPTSSATTQFSAEYFAANPKMAIGSTVLTPLRDVADNEYWTIAKLSGTADYQVELTLTAALTGPLATEQIAVVRNTGAGWVSDNDLTSTYLAYNASSGTARSKILINPTNNEYTWGFGPTGALPIVLANFDGRKTNGGNTITWKANCSANGVYTFELQRSTDGRNFTTVSSIKADKVRCEQPFDYTDNNFVAGATNYYRLRMIDADGKPSVSRVVAIINKSKGVVFAQLLPSVVNSKATVIISAAANETIAMTITDMNGRMVQQLRVAVQPGTNSIQINTAALSAGVYQLTGVSADGTTNSIRFIKQ